MQHEFPNEQAEKGYMEGFREAYKPRGSCYNNPFPVKSIEGDWFLIGFDDAQSIIYPSN
jgi:hypothetical protein